MLPAEGDLFSIAVTSVRTFGVTSEKLLSLELVTMLAAQFVSKLGRLSITSSSSIEGGRDFVL